MVLLQPRALGSEHWLLSSLRNGSVRRRGCSVGSHSGGADLLGDGGEMVKAGCGGVVSFGCKSRRSNPSEPRECRRGSQLASYHTGEMKGREQRKECCDWESVLLYETINPESLRLRFCFVLPSHSGSFSGLVKGQHMNGQRAAWRGLVPPTCWDSSP